MNLHEKITESRKNKGLTQEELADRANVSIRTIQRIESGETIPRSFTLKAIAVSLDISFEELTKKEPVSLAGNDDDIHFLKMLTLSCFSYLVIPYVHFLIPAWLLKKHKTNDPRVKDFGRRIIRGQVWWIFAVPLVFLLTLLFNLMQASADRSFYINYLWPFFLLYFANAVIIAVNYFRINSLFKEVEPQRHQGTKSH